MHFVLSAPHPRRCIVRVRQVIILRKNPDHVPTTLDDGKPGSPGDKKNLRISKPLSHW